MAVRIRAADDRRDLSLFLLKPDFGVLERAPIRADDASLDRRYVCRERRRENERSHENNTNNDRVPKHSLNTAPGSKARKCARCSLVKILLGQPAHAQNSLPSGIDLTSETHAR